MTAHIGGLAESILSRIEQVQRRPLRAMLEISDRCNEVCVHCYQVQGQKGEMSTAQVKQVIDELAELGVLILTISGGEATLRKDFLELVEHARARGFAVRIFTNGLTMTQALARRLAELAVHLVEISLYSHRAEVHDFVTGVAGSFERTLAGVRHLVAERVDVHVKTPLMRVNEGDIDAYVELATALGATWSLDPGSLLPTEGGRLDPLAFNRSADAFKHVLEHPRLGGGERTSEWHAPALSAPPCGAGETIHVEPNGELRPCTMLELPLGQALDGIQRARATDAHLRGVLALSWGDIHGCRECDLRAYCRRCHASALGEVGDALAPYPSACADARVLYEVTTRRTPRIVASGDRNPSIGPYRALEPGTFETRSDVVTPEDEALAQRLGWTRRARVADTAPVAASSGALLQIRRPGRATTRAERVPCADRGEEA